MALRDYALPLTSIKLMIWRPTIEANKFELKPIALQLIQAIQLTGLSNEDLNIHISNCLEVCDTVVKYNDVSNDDIRLRPFPLSLKEREKSWLNSMSADSITS